MKKIFLLVTIILVALISYAQPVSYRSNNTITVADYNLFAINSFKVPAYRDTTAANSAYTLDSCGKLIFTYNTNKLWLRACGPKRWLEVGSGNITGAIDSLKKSSDSVFAKKNNQWVFQYIDAIDTGSVGNLQMVTDNGNSTNNSIEVYSSGSQIRLWADSINGELQSALWDDGGIYAKTYYGLGSTTGNVCTISPVDSFTNNLNIGIPDTSGTLVLSVNGVGADRTGNITLPSTNYGSGDSNYIAKWSSSDTLRNSQIYDNGTNVGIGTTSPSFKLEVNGDAKLYNSLRAENNSGYLYGDWVLSNSGNLNITSGTTIHEYLKFQNTGISPFKMAKFIYDSAGIFKINNDSTDVIKIDTAGNTTISSLTGSGTRMVVADSLGKLSTQAIAGGGTVTSVATGYGLSGGTITTSGTLLVDSATLSNKYLRIVDTANKFVSNITRIPGKDSIFYTKGTATYSIKDSSGLPHGTASGTDTYIATINGATAYNDGDAYLIRFTNGNTTGATLNINGLGAISLYRNNDGLLIGGDIWAGAEMLCVYNSSLPGFQCIGTSSNSLFAYVTNGESTTITKGQAVYTSGGTGDRVVVKLANNKNDSTSARSLGVVYSSTIAANQKGIIIIEGQLDGLSIFPTSTWSDGDVVYLDSISGGFTKTKPLAPNHMVYFGTVTTANNGSAGRMYVNVQNGYELDEIHNVRLTSPVNNQVLAYSDTQSLWKNRNIYSIVDTTNTISTKYRVDTMRTNIYGTLNGKLNISDTATMLLNYQRITPFPIATFGAGSGAAGDTAIFTTSAIYGSFYNTGGDSIVITGYTAVLQGTSPSITPTIYFNDSLNVVAGATKIVNSPSAVTSTTTGNTVTSLNNATIPPGNFVWVNTGTVTTKPTYFSLTLYGYRKRP